MAIETIAMMGRIVGNPSGRPLMESSATDDGGIEPAVCVWDTGGALVAGHDGTMMMSAARVMRAVRASTRPSTVTPLSTVTDAIARMLPANVDPDPSIAEPVTCQKTLQARPPLMRRTVLAGATTRSDGAWKIQTAFG